MPQLSHATRPRNPNSASCRGAVRYRLEQARAFAQKQPQKFGQYHGNLPTVAAKLIANCGLAFSIRCCLETLFRRLITYCLHHTRHGYMLEADMRRTMRVIGVSRANVTTFVRRMVQLGLIIHIKDDLYRCAYYNCGTEERHEWLVQRLNSRLEKRHAKTRTYRKSVSYSSEAKASRASGFLASPVKKTKTLSTAAPASAAGSFPKAVPAAKQGPVQAPKEAQKARVLPLTPQIAAKLEQEAQAIDADLAARLPKGFALPNLGSRIIGRRHDKALYAEYKPAISEAEARGHTRANVAQQANWARRGQLVPIRPATAHFAAPGWATG